jgi:uncharacterized membrane protein
MFCCEKSIDFRYLLPSKALVPIVVTVVDLIEPTYESSTNYLLTIFWTCVSVKLIGSLIVFA